MKKNRRVDHTVVLAVVMILLFVVASAARADSWTVTGSMNEARTGHVTARTISNMSQPLVLVAGGYNSAGLLASAELFDPVAGTFESVGPMSTPRWQASATILSKTAGPSSHDKILITGGALSETSHLSSAEIYNYSSKNFSPTGSMATARRGHSSTNLTNGTVLVAGGYNGSFLSSAELWDPATGKFSSAGSMTAPRRAHTATLLPDGKVLITGGEGSPGNYLSSAELYDPVAGTFSAVGSMGFARTQATATLLREGKVLIAGGYNGNYLTQAELYDPATGMFTTTGGMSIPRRNHEASLLENGKVMINGGFNGGYPGNVELYDPTTGTFSNTVSLNSPRTFHTSAALPDGRILVAGGENSPTGILSSAELYVPDPPGNIVAGPFEFSEHPITQTTTWETTPRLGNDGVSDLVVFTRRAQLSDETLSKGDIWYQRLDQFGNPMGSAVQVTSGPQDFALNDISGDYIVYTAYDSTSNLSGTIQVYQISTSLIYTIATAVVMQEPRISGNTVVWREGGLPARVMIYDLAWLDTQQGANVLAGPDPPIYDLEIGNRFVVWGELIGGRTDIIAYDLATAVSSNVTASPTVADRWSSTDGAWIVWEVLYNRIMARNMDTGEERVVADLGVEYSLPSISGDMVSYMSILYGNYDIFLYRISTGETWQVTSNVADQGYPNVFGRLVAYVDVRTGNEDIYISLLNLRPIANAGAGQTVAHGSLVNLDGSASSDPDEDYPLSYAWEITQKPSGSSAFLVNPQSPNPTFIPDWMGDYKIRLIVTDALGATSDPAEVLVSTTNTPPVANAGPDQAAILMGSTVTLNGSLSDDLDGDSITYLWTMTEKPAGSQANLIDPTTVGPSFVADVYGDYVVSLVVKDDFGAESAVDTVIVSFTNVKPVANAGVNQAVDAGSTVNLNGIASSDANGDPLTYAWSIVSMPAGSLANLGNATSVQTSFVADLAGTYVISLVVNDGSVNSDPSNVTVTAILTPAVVAQVLQDAVTTINLLDSNLFKNPNNKNPLTNKINAVLNDIQNGLYADALSKLQNDILQKTDGCATGGSPDKNDWIITCPAQDQVYPILMEAIYLLQGM